MLKYVQDGVDESQPTALFVLNRDGLKLIHDFTVDPKVLAAALKRVRGGPQMVDQAMFAPRPDVAIHEMLRVLKPGGTATDPHTFMAPVST